jgi:hypothetical protein
VVREVAAAEEPRELAARPRVRMRSGIGARKTSFLIAQEGEAPHLNIVHFSLLDRPPASAHERRFYGW